MTSAADLLPAAPVAAAPAAPGSPWLAYLPPLPPRSPADLLRQITVEDYDALEEAMLEREQAPHSVQHHFAPGVYVREATLPAGAVVLGHAHNEGGLNIALSGEAYVKVDGKLHHVKAPCVLHSSQGTRKLAYVIKEMRWASIHPTTETDLAKLEALLITPSPRAAALRAAPSIP